MTRWRARFHALAALAADVPRQAMSSRLWWVAFGLTLTAVGLCLSLGIEEGPPLRIDGEAELYGADGQPLTGPNPNPGRLTLGFGLVSVSLFRDGQAMVRFLHAALAWAIAGGGGALLALIGTAGLLPEALRPSVVAVELTRPCPRPLLLLGRSLGILGMVAGLGLVLVVGTWVALGARTGVWDAGYLAAWPVMMVQYLALFGVAAWIAVASRSAAASLFGALLFWGVCVEVNRARDGLAGWTELAGQTGDAPRASRWIAEALYWPLPKPLDLMVGLDRLSAIGEHIRLPEASAAADRIGATHVGASIATTVLFAIGALALAGRRFARADL